MLPDSVEQRSRVLQQDYLSPQVQLSPMPVMKKSCSNFTYYIHMQTHGGRWWAEVVASPLSQLTLYT